ncbi:SDR family NAD(P)-dependent oxidoreductase [Nocardioides lentus]|uniref:SDR family NAD(P)-dependent oxidoreductase n=1 Tax=Nocardioides lentus TaxID=338077 RepID=A0ABN2PHL0_9ACTN
MTITLVTGANKGIGLETARRLLSEGHHVWVGSRDPDRGAAAVERLGEGARSVRLDVTDDRSVSAAVETIRLRDGRLDVLVNNAGIADNTLGAHDVDPERARQLFDANVVGVVRTTQAALPLLSASSNPVVVNVSSGLGSFAATADPGRPESQTPLITYAASKAAVNMLTVKYAASLPAFRVNAACPGLTATDFAAGFPGAQPVEEAVGVIVRLATLGPDGPTGTIHENDGPGAW